MLGKLCTLIIMSPLGIWGQNYRQKWMQMTSEKSECNIGEHKEENWNGAFSISAQMKIRNVCENQ